MNHLQNELAILGRFELTDTGRKYSKKKSLHGLEQCLKSSAATVALVTEAWALSTSSRDSTFHTALTPAMAEGSKGCQ